MKKKSLKILLTILAIFLMFFSVFGSFATDQSEDSYKVENRDVVLLNDDVVIDSNIEGNLVVKANNVTVKEGIEIRGDVMIFADTVTLESNTYVFSNLAVVANTLNLKGTAYSLYAAVDNINIEGYVYRDMKVWSGNKVSILGTIGRDAIIAGTSNITFKSNEEDSSTRGLVAGTLTYYANKQATSDFGDSVQSVNYYLLGSPSNNSPQENYIYNCLYTLANTLVVLAVLWVLLLKLTPKFVESAEKVFSEKRFIVFLLGLALVVIIPVLCILSLFLLVGTKLSLYAFILYILLLSLTTPIFVIGLNEFLANKFNIKTNGKKALTLLAIGTVVFLLKLIPYVGMVLGLLISLSGSGMIVIHIVDSCKKTSKTVSKKKA